MKNLMLIAGALMLIPSAAFAGGKAGGDVARGGGFLQDKATGAKIRVPSIYLLNNTTYAAKVQWGKGKGSLTNIADSHPVLKVKTPATNISALGARLVTKETGAMNQAPTSYMLRNESYTAQKSFAPRDPAFKGKLSIVQIMDK